ncbi:MAG: hypothetical protein KTR20_12280 [Cellvibrionaceae bacterium]|nr:hypothetical protein [Cellvibrionaceae bacterium]
MRNLRFLVWIVLFLSSCVTAGQDKVILCEKADCYSTYNKLNLQIKPLKNATEYSTGYGFFVDISNGFSKVREVDNGLVFQYQGQEKWIMLLAPAWNYEHIKVSGDSGSIFRGKEGLEIVMVEYKEGSDISYEAYITHKNMPDDKIYVISSLGINKSDFKDVISSIRFTSK